MNTSGIEMTMLETDRSKQFFVVSTPSVFEVLNWTVHDLLFQTQDFSRWMGFNTPMIMIIQSTFMFLTN